MIWILDVSILLYCIHTFFHLASVIPSLEARLSKPMEFYKMNSYISQAIKAMSFVYLFIFVFFGIDTAMYVFFILGGLSAIWILDILITDETKNM